MHPALDELIALEDGDRQSGAASHLETCPECQAEVARMRNLRLALKGLPPRPPVRDLWPGASARLRAERRRSTLRIASAAAVLLLTAGLAVAFLLRPAAPATAVPKSAAPDPHVAALIAQSQDLEQVLKSFEGTSTVMNSRSAGAIADLQDRIALIDLQIGMVDEKEPSRERLADLWKYRVQLLGSLVQIHQAQGGYTRI